MECQTMSLLNDLPRFFPEAKAHLQALLLNVEGKD